MAIPAEMIDSDHNEDKADLVFGKSIRSMAYTWYGYLAMHRSKGNLVIVRHLYSWQRLHSWTIFITALASCGWHIFVLSIWSTSSRPALFKVICTCLTNMCKSVNGSTGTASSRAPAPYSKQITSSIRRNLCVMPTNYITALSHSAGFMTPLIESWFR